MTSNQQQSQQQIPQQPPQVSFDAGYAIAQQTQRVNTVEDLLHRNESSLTHVLNRMKDVEVALNTVHRVTAKYPPEMQLMLDDLTGVKRKIDAVDQQWRAKSNDTDQMLQQELRNARPTPLANDPLYLRTVSEVQALRQEQQDGIMVSRRLGEQAAGEAKLLRQVEQDAKWLTDQVRDQMASHRDFSTAQNRRIEQLTAALQDEQQAREKSEQGVQQLVERAVRAVRDEFNVRFEAEAKARIALQNDVVGAFSRMREDVIKGFSQTATNLRNLDETAHSLETVLRAEVRSRMSHADEVGKRVEVVEERVRREATSAAEFLKQFDSQFNGAIRDVREVTQAELKSQLDSVWRVLKEVQTKVETGEAGGGGPVGVSADKLDLLERRQKMQMEAEMANTKKEVLASVDRRMESALPPRERIALKADLEDLRQLVNVKADETLANSKRQQIDGDFVTRSSFDNRLNTIEGRIDGSEKNVTAVAEALHGAQRDLGDKVGLMEKQARTMDAMQKNLQEAWDRDQQQMEGYLQGIREQVMALAEDNKGPSSTGAGVGDNSEATKTTFKLLEDELSGIRKEHRKFETDNARELAELKASANLSVNPAAPPALTGPAIPDMKIATLESRVTKIEEAQRGGQGTQSEGRSFRGASGRRGSKASQAADSEHVDEAIANVKQDQSKFEQKMMKELMALRMEFEGSISQSKKSAADVEKLKIEMRKLFDQDIPQLKVAMEEYIEEAMLAIIEDDEKRDRASQSLRASKSTLGRSNALASPPHTDAQHLQVNNAPAKDDSVNTARPNEKTPETSDKEQTVKSSPPQSANSTRPAGSAAHSPHPPDQKPPSSANSTSRSSARGEKPADDNEVEKPASASSSQQKKETSRPPSQKEEKRQEEGEEKPLNKEETPPQEPEEVAEKSPAKEEEDPMADRPDCIQCKKKILGEDYLEADGIYLHPECEDAYNEAEDAAEAAAEQPQQEEDKKKEPADQAKEEAETKKTPEPSQMIPPPKEEKTPKKEEAKKATDEKTCTQCEKPIGGGEYLESEGVYLHPECEEAYNEANAGEEYYCAHSGELLEDDDYVEFLLPATSEGEEPEAVWVKTKYEEDYKKSHPEAQKQEAEE